MSAYPEKNDNKKISNIFKGLGCVIGGLALLGLVADGIQQEEEFTGQNGSYENTAYAGGEPNQNTAIANGGGGRVVGGESGIGYAGGKGGAAEREYMTVVSPEALEKAGYDMSKVCLVPTVTKTGVNAYEVHPGPCVQ